MEYLLIASCTFSAAALIVLFIILNKQNKKSENFENFSRQMEELRRMLSQENSSLRQELTTQINAYNGNTRSSISEMATLLQNQMNSFDASIKATNETSRVKLDQMRETVEQRIRSLQNDNAEKLEKMRETVDEKLNATLEKRLTQSFSAVSDQLERVYKGLGEMQTLASGVGDLKKVLTNVKTRGTWGEVSLGNLLEQILAPSQYASNVKVTPRANEIVEYAICLPGKEDGKTVYLPLDCKFPTEDYVSLCNASETGDSAAVEAAARQLEASIKHNAMLIRDKYIKPPHTTDFAIMYLPVEGLYAEVVRRSSLCESLQRDFRVTVAGPTTIGAFLNSLQLGFKTLTIQKRSSEISKMLINIKGDFSKFSDYLEKTRQKLEEAGKQLDNAADRSRKINDKLSRVQSIETTDAPPVLPEATTE